MCAVGYDESGLLPDVGFHYGFGGPVSRRFMAEILKEKLSVKVLIIGYDHRFGHDRSEGFAEYVEYGRELGMEVVRADAFAMSEVNVSSSMVRACLAEGEVGMAARCLTRPYEITGRVVHGFHVGHELGFPTANIQVEDAQKLIPKNGVYAVWVKEKNRRRGTRLGRNVEYRSSADRWKTVRIAP